MPLLLDAGVLYAIADRKDAWHARVVSYLKKTRSVLLAPVTVLPEAAYLIRTRLGDRAERTFIQAFVGGEVALEPLTSAETNYMTCAADGVRLARTIDHPYVKLHLDVKAMSSEERPVPDVIRANRKFFHHFHANDKNLRGPGFGDVDFKPIFQALKDVSYTGWVSVEVFDYKPDPETIARESIRFMRECE